MMAKLPIRKLVLTAATLFGLLAVPSAAQAQNNAVRAASLLRDAMDAYSNLDLDASKSLLDQAIAMGNQLDKRTLARVYVSYGILWTGGFSDNAQGQKSFILALCLDPEVMVDPLLSSPDIDIIFNLSRSQATSAKCPGTLAAAGLSAQPLPPKSNSFPVCGRHAAMSRQKRKFELPFYLEMDAVMAGMVAKLKVFYAFDAAAKFSEIELTQKGPGHGALLNCDRGQIRIYDPSTVTYYIEGYNATGRLVCGHGSKNAPLEVIMSEDASPVPGIAGLEPKECAPCPPWDESCGKVSLPALGEPCQPDEGCGEGLTCGDLGTCETSEDQPKGPVSGPSRFYANLTGGVGFGYQSQEIEVRTLTRVEDDSGPLLPGSYLSTKSTTPAGFAFGGAPIRLTLGWFLAKNFSLELVGRFDVTVNRLKTNQSCLDALKKRGYEPDEATGNYSLNDALSAYCGGPKASIPDDAPASVLDLPDEDGQFDGVLSEEEARRLIEMRIDQNGDARNISKESLQIGWLAALRARYRVVQKGGLGLSVFLGAGYGQFSYNVPGGNKATYFPMVTGMVVEVGPELAYYFNNHVGFVVGLPIDVVFLDGFAVHFDPSLGLSFGF
ncbi:MAG: hypothetical protein MUC50_10635 [Myxococcota bacterium]|jgi:hypothetical protein|nr:hypothetical protein [Myxococcota bacterium]